MALWAFETLPCIFCGNREYLLNTTVIKWIRGESCVDGLLKTTKKVIILLSCGWFHWKKKSVFACMKSETYMNPNLSWRFSPPPVIDLLLQRWLCLIYVKSFVGQWFSLWRRRCCTLNPRLPCLHPCPHPHPPPPPQVHESIGSLAVGWKRSNSTCRADLQPSVPAACCVYLRHSATKH